MLSDSVEPSLLEVLPLVSLEAVSVVSQVSVVDNVGVSGIHQSSSRLRPSSFIFMSLLYNVS